MKAIFKGTAQISPAFFNDVECIEWALSKHSFIDTSPSTRGVSIMLKEEYVIKELPTPINTTEEK